VIEAGAKTGNDARQNNQDGQQGRRGKEPLVIAEKPFYCVSNFDEQRFFARDLPGKSIQNF
jgi:hypothetical protein